MRPPLLIEPLLEPTNLVQRLASRDVILSSWRIRKENGSYLSSNASGSFEENENDSFMK